jgi:hypothetical protein
MKQLLIIISFFICNSVAACSCFTTTLIEKVQNSAFIAKIKILKISEYKNDPDNKYAEIEVLELFKGNHIKKIKFSSELNNFCSLPVSENTTWLVFANKGKSEIMEFGYCSGSTELYRKYDKYESEKYPNAENNERKSNELKISVLQYFKSKNITKPNVYDLEIDEIVQDLIYKRLRGYEVKNQRFAVYEFKVEKNLTISKIKTLKAFDNQKLSDSLFFLLKDAKIEPKKGLSTLNKRNRFVFVLYYYPAEENSRSFISKFDL